MAVITLFSVMTVLVSCGERDLPHDESIEPSREGSTEDTADGIGTLSLNTNLISDYGRDFDELTEKYGKVTHYKSPGGGTYYKFESGYGYYCCGDVNRVVDWIYDENLTDETGSNRKCYAVVEGDTTCYSIDEITAGDLFSQSFGTLTAEDISAIPGITFLYTSEDILNYDINPRYCMAFKYSGFNNGKTCILIYTEKENEVTPGSEVSIFTNAPYVT